MGQKSGITLVGCQGGGIATLGAARFKVPWLNPWGRQIVAQIAEPKILARDIGPWAVVNGAACLTAPKQVKAFQCTADSDVSRSALPPKALGSDPDPFCMNPQAIHLRSWIQIGKLFKEPETADIAYMNGPIKR